MKIVATLAGWFLALTALAQDYPSRPVKVIVPWPPGQATDILSTDELKDRFLALGMDTASSTPEEMAAFMRREQERYGQIIKNANIKVE